jgi:very-short-patch-repair endonuclease
METQRTHREAALVRATDRQYGAFTRQQALDAGFTPAAIKQRLNRGTWMLVDHNVYRSSVTPQGWNQRLMAACLAGPAVASHRSAGILWDLPGMPDELIEVTALRHRRRKPPDVVWHESLHLAERDVTEIEGIPVTRPVRTFLDLGVVLSPDELEAVLNEGIRRSLLSAPAIARRLEELGPLRHGAAVVRATLNRHVPGRRAPESVLETKFLQLVRSVGLPEPVAQFQVVLGNGAIARLDFAYVDRKIAIELDGAAYHNGEVARKRDRQRDTRLGALGWRVLRFDWDDVTRSPDYVVGMMRPLGYK